MSARRPSPGAKQLSSFGQLLTPAEAQEPILAPTVRGALLEWLTEMWAVEELEEVGLRPRQRALFYGAPGTGKTTLAHHLAARLGLPMLAVRPETIIDCWMGSTGRNIGQLFDLARPEPEGEGPVLIFLDEFDALAPKRQASARDAQQERNAAVNTLLQRIDQHSGVLIAATNLQADIDPPIWRRFDVHVELALPGQRERELILARYLMPYGLPETAMRALAESCATASPAIMRQLCEALKRNLVLGERLGWDMARAATFDRVLSSIEPHPDLGKPALWSRGSADRAVALMPWPLPLASDVPVESDPLPSSGNVIAMRGV